jgi:hypothetical protein
MRALLLLTCSFLALSCSSKDDGPAATNDTGVADTATDSPTGGRKLDGDPAVDNSAIDPVPADLPVVLARTKASAGPQMDVPADFSCQGQPQPTVDTTLIERDFHTVELGGSDTDRVPNVKFEIFNVNKYPGTPTLTATSSAGADAMDPTRGSVKLKTATGNHAWHVFPQTGMFEIVVLDYSIDQTQLIVPVTAAPESKVAVIETLVGGSGYMFTPGNSRYVVTVRDCNDLDLMGVHVSIEVDGKVSDFKDGGVARSYFGDNKLPSNGKWTSRTGIVAFVNVPSAPKLRLVARARLSAGAAPEVVAMRTIPALPNGIVTGIVAPHLEP